MIITDWILWGGFLVICICGSLFVALIRIIRLLESIKEHLQQLDETVWRNNTNEILNEIKQLVEDRKDKE